MKMKEVFYTDDTKVKDLTVGQLKDIIQELLLINRSNQSISHTIHTGGMYDQPVYPDPYSQPWCSTDTSTTEVK